MPKNKGKGGKNRRRGKNENDNEKRELTFKEEGQGMWHSTTNKAQKDTGLTADATEYAQVVKMLGNGRLEAQCFDGEKRLGHIRGKLRKKVWINQGDIILLSLRDYQDEKGDVILKYNADEARSLKAYGELPESAKINETDTYGGEEEGIGFDFGEDDSESGGEVDIDDI
ncbi:nucleic acid-binding protein [Aureobasidium pullulans]|uniref:Eukaryotic translation initiation factor 4C n=1 Tax=Aureobasidium pullulans TaxID=5580 RepID=A0A4S9XJ85_AURPU|nr:nucleic acid-binding protein [Aureobasidium pullulans]THW22598.1 nucleic acid-binding protein [Aureobasidium pullulans]THW33437.1 nucleic acid-binding protein [Aureobasidium pullulans]THW47804.1 nucleic acid-binding protein [Aureobasidium pullulans]THW81419.1 nucleic acid-binding protein [Aureobasidium pullulans]